MQILNAAIAFFFNTPWLQALLASALTYLLARLVTHFLPKVLHKLTNTLKIKGSEALLGLLSAPASSVVLILGLIFSVELLQLSANLTFILQAGLRTLLILVLAGFSLRLSKLLLQMSANNTKAFSLIQPQTLPLFSNLAVLIVALSAIYMTFSTWNVDMSALLASAGIVGLAIGMAARDTLSDVIAGVLILTDAPYRVGDLVILEDGTRGKITHIGIRSTRLLTVENFDVTLPNAKIGNSKIVNESSSTEENRMIAVDVRLPYGSNLNQIRQEILAIADDNAAVLKKPGSVVKLVELETEYLHCRLLSWIAPNSNRYLVEFALNEMIYSRFQELAIPIYKPKENSIYVHELPATGQQIYIKEMPHTEHKIHITDMPSLFGKSTDKITTPILEKAEDILLKAQIKNPVISKLSRTAAPQPQKTTAATPTKPSAKPAPTTQIKAKNQTTNSLIGTPLKHSQHDDDASMMQDEGRDGE